MKLLVVEDDAALADVVRRGLVRDGNVVELCDNGDDALLQSRYGQYDAVVLDIMLPGTSGLDVCRLTREAGNTTPIILLTARDTIDDVVAGFEVGADDYLTKPFSFRELRARLQSIMRRAAGTPNPRLRAGDVILEVNTRDVWRGDQRIPLTAREYQVLEYLMYNQGKVLTRGMLEEHVWGYDYAGVSNTIDVHIRRLRTKLDVAGSPSIIETVRGMGYRLRRQPSESTD
jgi:DNA-binding response OmpR family regulator